MLAARGGFIGALRHPYGRRNQVSEATDGHSVPPSPPVAPRPLLPTDPGYPTRLLDLSKPPPEVTLSAPLSSAPTLAIVGTRKPTPEAVIFTRELARAVVEHGGVVASGGAVGIDSAAHEGALDGGGATWVIAATGRGAVFPAENALLFTRVETQGGVMVWPFPEGRKADLHTFFARNGVLAALAHALVIVQAGAPSGTLNAASWARRLKRPVWAVCAPPWSKGFTGCAAAIEAGARPLVSIGSFLHAVGLAPSPRRSAKYPRRGTSARAEPDAPLLTRRASTRTFAPPELELLASLSPTCGRHIDEIAFKSGLSAGAIVTALLTLALENVVVEGPEGFFRRIETR
jgi:DNA processing protein